MGLYAGLYTLCTAVIFALFSVISGTLNIFDDTVWSPAGRAFLVLFWVTGWVFVTIGIIKYKAKVLENMGLTKN